MLASAWDRITATCLLAALAGCSTEVYHNLGERQVNEAIVALREEGITADKQLDSRASGARQPTFALLVPRSEGIQALRVLKERGLPRGPSPGEVRNKGGLFTLPEEQRAARTGELTEELQRTLEGLPQVAEARVHLALPEEDPLRPAARPLVRPTASVLLRLHGPPPPAVLQEQKGLEGQVADLIGRAVIGLNPADVSVVLVMLPTNQPGQPLAQTPQALLVQVGPLLVAQDSRRMASALFALLFLLAAALLASLSWLWRSKGRP